MARRAGLDAAFTINSAGTYAGHAGEPPSRLALEAAARRGYDIAGLRARPVVAADIARFDHVLAMDRGHLAELRWLAPRGSPTGPACSPPSTLPIPMAAPRATTSARSTLIEAGCKDLLATLTLGQGGVASFLPLRARGRMAA